MVNLEREAKIEQWYKQSIDLFTTGLRLDAAFKGINDINLELYRTQLQALNTTAARLYTECGGKPTITTMDEIMHAIRKELNLPQNEIPL